MENISAALVTVFDPTVIIVCVLSGILGIVIGSLPGLTATLGAALLVPFTFFLDPVPAVASIITMATMAIFAGDIPGALLRMPGTPSSAAYVEDSYRLTLNGKGALALNVSLLASVIGALFGSLVLIFVAPIVGEFALTFTSFEYFWVAVLGLTAAVVISQGSQVKGAIALMAGLLMSTVGLDVSLGFPRFTFGSEALFRGIDFIPAMIGLFGVSEVLRNVSSRPTLLPSVPQMNSKGSGRAAVRDIWHHKGRLVQGNITGSIVGALPGAGADIAAWVSYAIAKSTSKTGAAFGRGKGHTEPLIAAGAANNAAVGSAFVPTLAFGIPGDTITAILIGVLLVKGIEPGPNLFIAQTDTLYAIYIVFMLANLLLLPLGFAAIRMSGLILRIPRPALMAAIIALSVTGAYAINNGYVEVIIVLALAIVGFMFERLRIPLAPVVLGLVLGPVVEANFMQSVIKTNWDLTQFFSRPVSAVLIVLTVVLLAYPLISKVIRGVLAKRKIGRKQGSGTPTDAESGR
ncbi:tripartite tricarboxylate transporter permease [Arthrobacter subterraneus]|uniref:tripartite tricarboxylate transporter permease n=1 Tax=Arthrobacter subterraneus TaxID=335973 RepID=UPI0038036A97